MSVINKSKLKTYLNLNYNVLFSGLHGVGKTTVLTQIFQEENVKWSYFSASTLDPWVDLIGIPRVVGIEQPKLELVRPAFFFDDIEVIFFDELNRAPDKVLNAVMELIQFKSINGFKFKKLRAVWGAINPSDDEDTYKVNKLDPAFLDRFQVKIDVPFKLDEEYFRGKYPDTAEKFIDWWNGLSKELRLTVSPRRLDYAAHAHANGCRLEDFLPRDSGIARLKTLLKSASFHQEIRDIEDQDEAASFLKDGNNATKLLELVKANDSIANDFFNKFGDTLPKELIDPFYEYVYARKNGFTVVSSIIDLVEKLPTANKPQITGAFINNVDLSLICSGDANLRNDLIGLAKQRPDLSQKLITKLVESLVVANSDQLNRAFWGIEGRSAGKPSNVQRLLQHISRLPDQYKISDHQKNFINTKLYEHKVVDNQRFL